ncbi:ExeA family protein [Roseateles sp.]|jgi:general secretion pathway protein A|uniref:ExeA family protein n=1 Tax=Roseateles sp. TaxID=1971397 RepID=UPI00391D7C40
MYAAFFGLRHEPFSIAPDPRYLFMSERHREALAHLLYGLSGGGGFVLLTGEIGAGKTTVCRCFLEQVPDTCDIAYIFNPRLTVRELLRTVCEEFHIELPAQSVPSLKDLVDRLNRFLLQAHAQGRSCVLIIDEAQNLAPEVLEQLRLLTNLETSERKLLQIILIGQPELRTMLARPELEQLAQRVIARYHLGALSAEESAQYVRHRLAVAGGAEAALPFDARALKLIHRLSRGVPRRINLLCDRALLGAYAQGRAKVDARTVRRAAAEVFGGPPAAAPAAPRRSALLLGGGLGLAALATAAVLGLGERLPWSQPSAQPAPVAASASAVPASVAEAASAPASAAASEPAQALESSVSVELPPDELGLKDERQAWAALARFWGLAEAEALAARSDPCQALKARADAAPATETPLQCFRSTEGLAQLRLLDRPALLRLQPPDQGAAPVHALLVGLDGRQARLRLPDGRVQRLDLLQLSRLWRGEFLTLWRSPPGGYSGRGLSEAGLGWLDQQLAQVFEQTPLTQTEAQSRARFDAALRKRLASFQRSQGLRSDGRPSPVTLMQLNRAVGLNEPRLDPHQPS